MASLTGRSRRRNDLPWFPRDRTLVIIALVVCVVLIFAPFSLGRGDLRLLIEIFCVLAMAQMWNLLAGYVGLMSIGHQAFVGIGAYALFAASNFTGLSPYYALVAAPVVCTVIAAALAPVLFRLRDAYFSIAIWVFAEMVAIVVGKWHLLGRQFGMTLVGVRTLDRAWFTPITFWLAVATAVASIVVTLWLLRTRIGLALMAVRDNETAAASLGIDVWWARFVAFVISAAGCGLAGAIYYMTAFQVVPTSAFDINWVVQMLFITIIGGMGRIEGPIIGTIVYFGLREFFAASGNWYLILMGVVAVVVMLVAPKGIWGTICERYNIEILSVRRAPPQSASGSDK